MAMKKWLRSLRSYDLHYGRAIKRYRRYVNEEKRRSRRAAKVAESMSLIVFSGKFGVVTVRSTDPFVRGCVRMCNHFELLHGKSVWRFAEK